MRSVREVFADTALPPTHVRRKACARNKTRSS